MCTFTTYVVGESYDKLCDVGVLPLTLRNDLNEL